MTKSFEPIGNITMPPYEINNKVLYKNEVNKKGEPVQRRIARGCYIHYVKRNVDEGTYKLGLGFWAHREWHIEEIERGQLYKTDIKYLMNKGLDINNKNAEELFQYLHKCATNNKPIINYKKIGWHYHGNVLHYQLYEAVPKQPNRQVEYVGQLHLKQGGTYEGWLDTVNTHVVGHTELEFVLAAGFSAPIVGLLNASGLENVDTLLLDIVGNSSTGKTSAAYVFTSGFGSPHMNKNGLVQSANGTSNAIQGRLKDNFGVPMVFDETSAIDMTSQQLSTLIYSLAQNQEKMRLNQESELKEPSTWATSLLFTGESSVLEQANANAGLRVRMFEFDQIQWTKDAEHSDGIKEGFSAHFGHAGLKFGQALYKLGAEKVREQWQLQVKQLVKVLPESQYRERIASKFGLILLSATLINQVLGMNLNLVAIQSFLIEQEKVAMADRDLVAKFIAGFEEYVIKHLRHFKMNKEVFDNKYELFGRIEQVGSKANIYILPTQLKIVMNVVKINNKSLILKSLKAQNQLKHDDGKLLTKKQLLSSSETDKPKGSSVYCIILDSEFLDTSVNETNRRSPFQGLKPKRSQASELVEYDELCDIDEI